MATHQETEGVLSPFIRDIRLRQVSRRIRAGETVLDLACGNLYLGKHLRERTKYFGVDRTPTTSDRTGYNFLLADLLSSDAPDQIERWACTKFDVISCAAFLEHISNPTDFLARYTKLLKPGGRVVGTTPHPKGRDLHDNLARIYLCSRSGAAEHENFLSKDDLEHAAKASGGRMIEYKQFLFGLNQVFVLEYA